MGNLYECSIKQKMLVSLCMPLVLMIGAYVYRTLDSAIARIRRNIDCCDIYPDILYSIYIIQLFILLFCIIIFCIAYFMYLTTPCSKSYGLFEPYKRYYGSD